MPEREVQSASVRFALAFAARTGFITLDGEMSLEDRATVSATLALQHTTIGVRGFVARTTWWMSKDDPGQTADVGGGELTAAVSIHGFDITAGLGRARTFYPTLDGAPVDAPTLGTRATRRQPQVRAVTRPDVPLLV